MAARKVRIYQEDWFPFQNLPAAAAAFERATGIGVEIAWDKVGVGTIEHMFDRMARRSRTTTRRSTWSAWTRSCCAASPARSRPAARCLDGTR